MFVTKKCIPRRMVLRGVGASLSLPLLESMAPAQAASTPAPARLACIEMVHGAAGSSDAGSHYWSPAAAGSDFEFSYTLEPLAPFRRYVTVISGCDVRPAEASAPAEVGADHFRSSAAFLTGVRPRQTSGDDFRGGVSMDQIYARHVGSRTRIPSLQLGIEQVDPANSCAFNYHCVYSDAISWASPANPLPPVINPRHVFEALFGAATPRNGRGAVDAVLPQASRLSRAVGPGDKRKLDEYLEGVRGVERRIEAVECESATSQHRERYTAPIGVPDSWEDHVKLLFDLQILAFVGDVTRTVSFKMSHDVSNRVFPNSGVSEPFHTLSHHREDPARLAKFAQLNRYHVGMISHFLDRLNRTADGGGSLLDHTLVLYGSPMGDSETHNHRRVPLFLAGGACGQLKGNLHHVCPRGTPQANVLLTVLRRLGVSHPSIGDSTGEVSI
ncbi:MAG: DUF1552 domain-containing protein [Bryobacteraceae bacterium]